MFLISEWETPPTTVLASSENNLKTMSSVQSFGTLTSSPKTLGTTFSGATDTEKVSAQIIDFKLNGHIASFFIELKSKTDQPVEIDNLHIMQSAVVGGSRTGISGNLLLNKPINLLPGASGVWKADFLLPESTGERGFYWIGPGSRSEIRVESMIKDFPRVNSSTDLLRSVDYLLIDGRIHWIYDVRRAANEMFVDLIPSVVGTHQKLMKQNIVTYPRSGLIGIPYKPTMNQIRSALSEEDGASLMATRTVKGIWDALDRLKPGGISQKTLLAMNPWLARQAFKKYSIPLTPFWQEQYPDRASVEAAIKKHTEKDVQAGHDRAFPRPLQEAIRHFQMDGAVLRRQFREAVSVQEKERLASDKTGSNERMVQRMQPEKTLPSWPQQTTWTAYFDYIKKTMAFLSGISDHSVLALSESEKPETVNWGEWSAHFLSTSLTMLDAGHHFFTKGVNSGFVFEEPLTIVESLEQNLEKTESGISILSAIARSLEKENWREVFSRRDPGEKEKLQEPAARRAELLRLFVSKIFIEDSNGAENRAKFIEAVRALEKGFLEISKRTESALATLEDYSPKRALATLDGSSPLKEGMLLRIDNAEYWIYDIRGLETKGSVTLWKRRRNHFLRSGDKKVLHRRDLTGASVIERGTSRLGLREVVKRLAELPESAQHKLALRAGEYADSELSYAIAMYHYPLPASPSKTSTPKTREIVQRSVEVRNEVLKSPFSVWIPAISQDLRDVSPGQLVSLEDRWREIGERRLEALGLGFDQGSEHLLNFLRDNIHLIFTLDQARFDAFFPEIPETQRLLKGLKGVATRHGFLRAGDPGVSSVSLAKLSDRARFLLEHPDDLKQAFLAWQPGAAAPKPVVMPQIQAVVLDAAFLSVLENSREVNDFCEKTVDSGSRLMLTYDRQRPRDERLVRALLSAFVALVPFAYLPGRMERQISHQNVVKRVGQVPYLALFPVSAGQSLKASKDADLMVRGALADEAFVRKVIDSHDLRLEHVMGVLEMGLLRNQLEDTGYQLRELTPQSFNHIIQFLNMLAENYQARKVAQRAA